MARAAESFGPEDPFLLPRYLRSLFQHPPTSKAPAPARQWRTCAACGARVAFAVEAEGTWAHCPACGRYA